MEKTEIYIGKSLVLENDLVPEGRFVDLDGEKYYQIENYQSMPDFFISIVSDSDHWMFISSNGSLSAGRKNRDNALFPYYTVDKIHDYKGKTGGKTYFLVNKKGKTYLWEPFSDQSLDFYNIKRNLYKNMYGNKIRFEEVNEDLELSFRYEWNNSDKFGFVKRSAVINTGKSVTGLQVLDGIKNILPYGVDYAFQNEYSNLLDAYKKNERIKNSTLGVFSLSSIPVDRAEPSESLKATTVWSAGVEKDTIILLSENQVRKFTSGHPVTPEYDVRAARGSYYIHARFDLEAGQTKDWNIIAEINQDTTDVVDLLSLISNKDDLNQIIDEDTEKGTSSLKKLVSRADGFQTTNTDITCARHFTNTLFNIMRGGVFANDYLIDKPDYIKYLIQINRSVYEKNNNLLESLPEKIDLHELFKLTGFSNDPDLERITYEYLPLTFSRRHGDPSRPWNLFSIETKNEDGSNKFYYAGNWRDIFQNWEALSYSYPEFVEGIISKFLNASTFDGYNPYRITRDGIDWESPDPDDPWAYIGYWGDHQIIYLQKLLELSFNFHPGKLDKLLTREIFTYANVPYRIKPYIDILSNPRDTIVFNKELDIRIKEESILAGADASLLKDNAGKEIYKVNLVEKILATLLSKLCNLIPESGIWLNTQRPEWNDANNALVGYGTSMVTLYYLRRFLKFWQSKFTNTSVNEFQVSQELGQLFERIVKILNSYEQFLKSGFTDEKRKYFTDSIGTAHSDYRNTIYNFSFSGEKKMLRSSDLRNFTELCIRYIDQSIRANKRDDGLYHAYNLISIKEKSISIRFLYEMLEGQVAVLSSGLLSPAESLEVLDALKKSKMFRPDQFSYMLYPDRNLPRFLEKNFIPKKRIEQSVLFQKLIDENDTSVIRIDTEGNYHFNGSLRNADELASALDKLNRKTFGKLIDQEKSKALSVFEEVFDHQSFTGRSGTFYGYEGLGSIYWHMVSKLLLAVGECYLNAVEVKAETSIVNRLKEHYYEIKAGIGVYKNPSLYGAFPTDAYSHTPGNAGVKQPGLTGQVKEDVISRFLELGLIIEKGKITFNPSLLNQNEILEHPATFEYFDLDGKLCTIQLKKDQVGFTFCQVPIIYTKSQKEAIHLTFQTGEQKIADGHVLEEEVSKMIFNRSGAVKQIDVLIK